MNDLSQWYITEYEWHPAASQHYEHLQANVSYLTRNGAHVISESVDGFNPSGFLRKHHLHANDVATVVWGSPCTDVSSGGYAHVPDAILSPSEQKTQKQRGLDSNTVKSAIFKHLQEQFPHALVIITCAWCSPNLLHGIDQKDAPDRVLLFGSASVPAIGGVQYAPSFAHGASRVDIGNPGDMSSIKVLAAIPQTLVANMHGKLFTPNGEVDLYRLIATSAKSNVYYKDDDRQLQTGAQLFFGEEKADLSRCAAEFYLERKKRGQTRKTRRQASSSRKRSSSVPRQFSEDTQSIQTRSSLSKGSKLRPLR